jgi:AAA+ superfamily predicted ATPase
MAELITDRPGEARAGSPGPPGGLLSALGRLDRLLARAVSAARAAYGPEAAGDPYRGLCVGPDEAARLVGRQPGVPLLWAEDEPADGGCSRLGWLARAFGLSRFEADVVVVALAPDLDLRYERLYAFLQDDVTRKRPTVDLALNLLCPSAEVRLRRLTAFLPGAPLVRHDLIRLVPDPQQVQPPLLSHYLKPDEQLVRLLLGHEGLDARLAPFCELIDPTASLEELPLPADLRRALPALASQARSAGRPLRLYFHGPPGTGRRAAAEGQARAAGLRLLAVDLVGALAADGGFERALRLAQREAWFQDAVLFLDGLDALRGDERAPSFRGLMAALAGDGGITILAGARPWLPAGSVSECGPLGTVVVPFAIPDHDGRRAAWEACLTAGGFPAQVDDLDALAGRFRLTPRQIADAVATACNQAAWRAAARLAGEPDAHPCAAPTFGQLLASARAQSGHHLAALAHKIEPASTWDDIVLSDDALAQLREICQRVAHRDRVLASWGFDRKLALGKAVNALFVGPSGTGKTMAAEVIAAELGLDLYRIDLSGVVSKWIGETEKNLDRIFAAAESANAILFFDEADALFGKRSEVRDAHDRYANIEVAYLLQKIEQYDGIAILATNLRGNLDESFTRRLAFTVHFPFPDADSRARIWAGIWPKETPLADDVDPDLLARQLKLSGGNIKNVALAAAFLAADEGSPVRLAHVLRAVRREYQKMGKVLSLSELGVVMAEACS